MEMDMTTGKPVKALLKFSVPLFAGNIMQNLYNVFDTAVVGHILGKNALAAVGNSELHGFHTDIAFSYRRRAVLPFLFICQRDFYGNGHSGRGYWLCNRLFEDHSIGDPVSIGIQFLFCGDKSRR